VSPRTHSLQKQALLTEHRNDLYCVEWGVKLYSLTPRWVESDRGFYHG